MTNAETNRGDIRYAIESAWGEDPSGVAATQLRITGESLNHQKGTVVSNEIISTGDRSDIKEVSQGAAGDIQFEFQWSDFEPFIEAALRNTITSVTVVDASATMAASSISFSSGTTPFSAFTAGQWVRVGGASAAANNGIRQISSITTSTLTFRGATGSADGANSVHITGRNLRNGTTNRSFFLETDFEDISAVKYFRGMRVGDMSLSVAAGQIITGSFSFLGRNGAAASASVASSVVTSAGTNDVVTAAVNVGTIEVDDATLSDDVASFNLRISNNLRPQNAIGSKPAIGIGVGGIDVTGDVQLYFASITEYNKFINHSSTGISIPIVDDASNTVYITIPNFYYTGGDPTLTGVDADVFVTHAFQARRDPTLGYTIQFDFIPST